jgi:hypothetical protein
MQIFLDDDPVRDSWVDDTWVIVRDTSDVILLGLEDEPIELLSLDHDLGDHTHDGYYLMKHLEVLAHRGEWDRIPQRFEIHSANPVGRKNMQAAIDSIERMRENA